MRTQSRGSVSSLWRVFLSVTGAVTAGSSTALGAGSCNSASVVSAGATSAEGTHACLVTIDGAAQCWGFNLFGQLGNGTTTSSTTPVQVSGLASGASLVSAGGGHTCALIGSGAAECWGYSKVGQLGNGTTTNSSIPVLVSGLSSGVISIAAGLYHTCAVTNAGAALCWGDNGYGQLGNNTTTTETVPVAVSFGLFGNAVSVTAGDYHSCAVTGLGAAVCWGLGSSGQLGTGASINQSLTPVAVADLSSGVKQISAGVTHTCAVTNAGSVFCWGANQYGQLGNGTTTQSNFPVGVSGLSSGAVAVSAGEIHSCAHTSAGGVLCWGDNSSGELGNGTNTGSTVPVAVSGLSGGVQAISAGSEFTCAVTEGGAVECWGNNGDGNLGDGNGADTNAPVMVSGFNGSTSGCLSNNSAPATDGPLPLWALGALGAGLGGIASRRLKKAAA
jgi:alpha-tubulin suppressor-like RCC1 family protein